MFDKTKEFIDKLVKKGTSVASYLYPLQGQVSQVKQARDFVNSQKGNIQKLVSYQSPFVFKPSEINVSTPKSNSLIDQAKFVTQMVSNQPLVNLPFKPKPLTNMPTTGQLMNTVADVTYRPIARAGFEAAQSISGDKNVYTPQTNAQKFLLGNEPLRNYSDPNRFSRQLLRGTGMSENNVNTLAMPLIGLGILTDLTLPGTDDLFKRGGKKALSKETLKILEPVIAEAKNYSRFDDFAKAVLPKLDNVQKETLNEIAGKGAKTFNPNDKLDGKLYKIFNDEYQNVQDALVIDRELRENLPKGITGRKALSEYIDQPIAGVGEEGAMNIAEKLKLEGYIPDFAQQSSNVYDPTTTLRNVWKKYGAKVDYPKVEIDRTKLTGVTLSKSNEQLQKIGKRMAGRMPGFEIAPPTEINVTKKINIYDKYLRTPEKVLQKIGLGEQAKGLRAANDKYLKELPEEIDRITQWSKRVGKGSEVRIFQYLDGNTGLKLNSDELKVATEIKDYLKGWADKLNLPEDKRVSNYITHIFDNELVQKEFDPDLAKILRENVAGSVYDPFVQQRLGKRGYKEDVFQALDAYVKRATRKYNMDPALESIKKVSDNLETSQYNYVKSYIDNVNMRPTELDNIIDNTIKQSPIGYKYGQRPSTVLTRKLRQAVYRGTLGLNPGSALRNLTQGINTYSQIGEKYTVKGYLDLVKETLSKSDELERVGVLKNDFVQDRTINATKKFWEKLDKGLFFFFETAERINRGAAYYGAKAKALNKGLDESQAIEYAKEIVRKTQFSFGAIDTPPIFSGDVAKTLLQFQSFNVKQLEFLTDMAKSKDTAGLVRFAGASMVMYLTAGKAMGLDVEDLVPFGGVFTGKTKLGQTPAVKLGADIIQTAFNSPDKYGQQPDLSDRIDTFKKDLLPFIPGGVQLNKTAEGVNAWMKGASTTKTGRTRYEIDKTPGNLLKAATLGQYTLPGADEYFNNMGKSKSEIIYNALNDLPNSEAKNKRWNELVKDGTINKNNISDIRQWFIDDQIGLKDKERKYRSLGVEDGSRASKVVEELKRLKTPEEKDALWKKYVKGKIITKEVAKQIRILYKQTN